MKKVLNNRLGVQIIQKKSFIIEKMILHPGALFPTFWGLLFLEQASKSVTTKKNIFNIQNKSNNK